MIQIEKIAESLFDKIRSRFNGVTIGDENAKATLDPEKARFFNFDFVEGDKNYGNVTLSIVDDNNLKVYYGKEIDADMDNREKQIWYNFLKNLRLFAKRNLLTFDVRDIAKSGLDLKDLKHANKDANVLNKTELNTQFATESKQYGTSRSTYEPVGNVRIIARHKSRIVDETKPGARSRNIECFYVENSLGERFRLPEGTTFNGARAYARHIKEGGNLQDAFGQHITKIISEMNSLKTFVRNMRGKQFEDAETNSMVESAIDHYGKLHRDLFSIRGQRGYEQYRSLWQPEQMDEEDIDLDALRERFVRKVFDDRLTDALPIVYRAYKTRKDKVGDEFESWANDMVEDDNPADEQNKQDTFYNFQEDNDSGEFSPLSNDLNTTDSDGNVIDGDSEDEKLAELFQENGFEFRFQDGVYQFESKEELERAKDIIAAHDPNMEFPRMEVYNSESKDYGSSTFDKEIQAHGVMSNESKDNMTSTKWDVTYDIYGSNREKPLYTKTRTVSADTAEEAISTLRRLVGGTNYKAVPHEKKVDESSDISLIKYLAGLTK